MNLRITGQVHGSFGMDAREEYTLWTSRGAFNLACAQILDVLVQHRYTGLEERLGRRCLIGDVRDWHFQTPECSDLVGKIFVDVARHHEEFHAAYLTSTNYPGITEYLIDKISEIAPSNFHWRTFREIEPALSWLRSLDYRVPDLTWEDFPEPVSGEVYLKRLQDSITAGPSTD